MYNPPYLDYCNILLTNFPHSPLSPSVHFPHQRQSKHSFYITTFKTETVSSSYNRALRWLSTELRIKWKLLALVHNALHAPPFLYTQIVFYFLFSFPQGFFISLPLPEIFFFDSFNSFILLVFSTPLKFHLLRKAVPDHTY